MQALLTPTSLQLKEFYPVSASLPDAKREELANFVKQHLFLKMFGFEGAKKIIDGTTPDSASAVFIGFQKFFALCCAYQEIKDPLTSTNFGAKIVTRPGVSDPSNSQKSITMIDIENTISIHYKAAIKILTDGKCGGLPNWEGIFSYKVSKL